MDLQATKTCATDVVSSTCEAVSLLIETKNNSTILQHILTQHFLGIF